MRAAAVSRTKSSGLWLQVAHICFEIIINVAVEDVIGIKHATLITLTEFRCSSSFMSTLFVNVSRNYDSAAQKFGTNFLLEIPNLPFKKVCADSI
jgi:hypothetical protein